MKHVAILKRRYLESLVNGEKRVEARLLRRRIAPFGAVRVGDEVFLKAVGGEIEYVMTVGWRIEREDLRPSDVAHLRERFGEEVGAPSSWWEDRMHARHAVLMRLVGARSVLPGHPVLERYSEARVKQPRAAWLVLEETHLARAA